MSRPFRRAGALVAALLLVGRTDLASAQDAKKNAKPDPMQLKIDEAIRQGTEFLKEQKIHPTHREIVLLTLIHAGVSDQDAKLQGLLKDLLAFKGPYGDETYNISLLAMALEELDRVTYQKDIFKCAQYLVDNQAQNGQWGYGKPTTFPEDVPTVPVKSVATPAKAKPAPRPPAVTPGVRVKPPVRFTLTVKAQRDGGPNGDNSNSQYAALGLRACHDAGIVFPREAVERAKKWWVDTQSNEDPPSKDNPYRVSRGWSYASGGADNRNPKVCRGSMTVGAVGAICIYHFMLGTDWKSDPAVQAGLGWTVQHFSVTENPQFDAYHHYYLYALERLGVLYGSATFGGHDWYAEGAKYLLESQKEDGSWVSGRYHSTSSPLLDTCFAILFLRRATRPLLDVASEDRFHKK